MMCVRNIFIIVVRFFLCISLLCFTFFSEAQEKKGRLSVNTKSDYILEYSINESLFNGKRKTVYEVRKTGDAPNNELLIWQIPVYRNNRLVNVPFKMEILKGSKTIIKKYEFALGDELSMYEPNGKIESKIITLPYKDEFEPVLLHDGPFVIQGETITLKINSIANFENIEWYWTTSSNSVKQGQIIEDIIDGNTLYNVYGKYKGTTFRTISKSIRVDAKRAKELVDFSVKGPSKAIDDTSSALISLDVKHNILGNKLRWTIEDEFGRVVILNDTIKVSINPVQYFITGKVKVCPMVEQKKFGCQTYEVPLNQLNGPSDFDVKVPKKMFTNESIVLKPRTLVKRDGTYWNWTINGKYIGTSADSIVVNPLPDMQISVYPTLNKREGKGFQKNFTLRDVVVRSVLPKNINGNFKFCGQPSNLQEYLIDGAILGSDAKSWVLSKDGSEVLRFSGNRFRFRPTQTGVYYINPDNSRDLRYAFSIEVVDIPKTLFTIQAPDTICENEPLILLLKDSGNMSEYYSFNWSRKYTNSREEKKLSTGTTLVDTAKASALYVLKPIYKGCEIKGDFNHLVTVQENPIAPDANYFYIKSYKDRVKLLAYAKIGLAKTWQWSVDSFKTIIADTNLIDLYKLKPGYTTFAVRYIDNCNKVSPHTVFMVKGEKYNYFFINAGVNMYNQSFQNSFSLTLGNKNLYVRTKLSQSFILRNSYSNEYQGKKLLISDLGKVENYPTSSGTYYIVNGGQALLRASLTAGVLFGSRNFRGYIGAGYGQSDIVWGVDIESYSTSQKTNQIWAINSDQSAKGLELETGLFIKIGSFNFMSGVSLIQSPNLKKPFMELNFGIGFSIR
jgi:hypothetical protein